MVFIFLEAPHPSENDMKVTGLFSQVGHRYEQLGPIAISRRKGGSRIPRLDQGPARFSLWLHYEQRTGKLERSPTFKGPGRDK